jgi:hypothetical protein
MSALPPKADINRGERYVRFVPIADTPEFMCAKPERPPRGGLSEITHRRRIVG